MNSSIQYVLQKQGAKNSNIGKQLKHNKSIHNGTDIYNVEIIYQNRISI